MIIISITLNHSNEINLDSFDVFAVIFSLLGLIF